MFDESYFFLDLLFTRTLVDATDDRFRFLHFVVPDELARRLRTERQTAGKYDRWNATKADHVSPAMGHVGKSSSDSVADNLSTSNLCLVRSVATTNTSLQTYRHVIQTDQAASNLRRSNLSDVKWNDLGID